MGDKKSKKVYDKVDGKLVERVDLKLRPNLINLDHQHNWYKDGSEDTETYYSIKCRHPQCPLGMLINKNET